MFDAIHARRQKFVLKSGAFAAVLASLGVVVVTGQQPRQFDGGENSVLAVGLRLNQYGPVTGMPTWIELPDRSTDAYGSRLADADNNRVYFRSLSSAKDIERHFRGLLLANGFQLAFMHPASSGAGVVSLITAFDQQFARSVEITVRHGKAVRSVEILFSGGHVKPAPKGLSISF